VQMRTRLNLLRLITNGGLYDCETGFHGNGIFYYRGISCVMVHSLTYFDWCGISTTLSNMGTSDNCETSPDEI
jgi:hypothetical protein